MKDMIKRLMMVLVVFLGLQVPSVKAAEHYVIATDTTFAPFEFQDSSGNYVGIDMDLLAAIAEAEGFTYEIKPLGFAAAVQALESDQVDGAIAGMTITDARKASFDFSDNYYESGLQFAVAADSKISDLEGLRGKKIAVKTGTAGADLANKLKDDYKFTVVTFKDSANMYEDVLTGNSDATIEDAPVIAYAIKNGNLRLKLIGEKLETSQTGFAVKKGKNAELLAAFNRGLASLKSSGKYQSILDKYIGEDAEASAQNSFFGQLAENGPRSVPGLFHTCHPYRHARPAGG